MPTTEDMIQTVEKLKEKIKTAPGSQLDDISGRVSLARVWFSEETKRMARLANLLHDTESALFMRRKEGNGMSPE